MGHFTVSDYLQKISFPAFQCLPDEVPEDTCMVGSAFRGLTRAFMESEMVLCDSRPIRGF